EGHRYPRSVLRRARDPWRRRRLVTRRNRSDGREFPSPLETAPGNHRGHAYLLDAAGTELSRRNGTVSTGLLRAKARAESWSPDLSWRPCAQGAGKVLRLGHRHDYTQHERKIILRFGPQWLTSFEGKRARELPLRLILEFPTQPLL